MRNLLAPRSFPGAERIVSVATGSIQVTMQLSAVIAEKIKHKHSQKESNFPLPSLTSALPPCSRPLEFIQPLATRAEAWQAIPGVSEWVMGIIKRGYSLQFARRPPRFSGVVSTSVQGENARVLRSEVMTLLEKGAIEMVPPALSESGFYSHYFLVPKKDGGLRPILDLRRLNHALMRRPFRMIRLKQILSQIRTEDWFCSLDLKDAYFHIQIAPHHRRFLRFAFEGVAYLEPLRAPGAQGQFRQKRTVSQPTNIVPGYSSGLSSHESGDSARTRSGHSETRGHLQERHRSPTQSVSENAGPYGRSIASVTAGPAPHAPPSTLVETMGSTQRMASRTLAYQGESGLYNSPDPLEEPTVDGEGRGNGVGPHQKSCHDRRLQHRLGGTVRRQTDLRPLVGDGERLPHQLLGNASISKDGISSLRRTEPTGLPEQVLNTISEARAPSTRRLYALKWSVFSTWGLNRGENPSTSELAVVLSFLQELLDKGRSHFTLKVFVAAIAAFHAPIAGQSVGRDNSVVHFLKGARRLNPPRPLTVPTWDLPTVLRALKGPPFEPLQSTDLRSLSLKTALLLALASVKRVETCRRSLLALPAWNSGLTTPRSS